MDNQAEIIAAKEVWAASENALREAQNAHAEAWRNFSELSQGCEHKYTSGRSTAITIGRISVCDICCELMHDLSQRDHK